MFCPWLSCLPGGHAFLHRELALPSIWKEQSITTALSFPAFVGKQMFCHASYTVI